MYTRTRSLSLQYPASLKDMAKSSVSLWIPSITSGPLPIPHLLRYGFAPIYGISLRKTCPPSSRVESNHRQRFAIPDAASQDSQDYRTIAPLQPAATSGRHFRKLTISPFGGSSIPQFSGLE